MRDWNSKVSETCDICLKQKTLVALPHQNTFRCLSCTPTVILLPPSLKTKREAAVLEHYDDMPLPGRNDGDTYFITSLDALCRWDAKKQDYETIQLDQFRWPKPEDEFNNRRAAIMAQRARKKS